MGWDGSGNVVRNTGVFQGATAWQQTRDAARRIRADDHDTHDEDIATAIENTVTRDGQNQPTANLPMGGNRHTNCGEGQALSDYSTLGQNQKSTSHICTVGGTGDAILLTADIPPSSYQVGQKFIFFSGANNTGPVTVNVNGLGAVNVKKRGGHDLEAGDIVTSEIVIIYYDNGSFLLSTLSNQGLGKTGNQTLLGQTLRVEWDSDTNNDGPLLQLMRKDGTTTRLGAVEFRGQDDAATPVERLLLNIRGNYISKTAGAESAEFIFGTRSGGAFAAAARLGKGLYMQGATGDDPGTGGVNAQIMQENGKNIYSLQGGLQAEQVGSGTALDFTGIRNDARRITIMFAGLSLNGTDDFLIQLGTSTGFETTGYNSTSMAVGGAGVSTLTSGLVVRAQDPGVSWSGRIVLTLVDPSTNKWVSDHTGKVSTSNVVVGGGEKSLAAVLTQIRVTRTGTNIFDAGSVNVLIE